MSAAEHQRKQCQKLKETGQYDKYKEKHATDQQKYHKRQDEKEEKLPLDETSKLIKKKWEKCCKQVAKHRLLKTIEMGEKHEIEKKRTKPFNSFSALAKATTRAQCAIEQFLPKTPNRREAVQRELFCRSAIQNVAVDEPIERPKPVHTLSDDVMQQVENFYRRDDISRQAPGRKDVVSVKENGSCTKYQTRHLTSSVNEVFALFQEEYLKVKIGRSKSASLCPTDVLLSSKIPRNVCLCKYHENVIIAL